MIKLRVSGILIVSDTPPLMDLRAALENLRYRFESSSARTGETFTVKRVIIIVLLVLGTRKAGARSESVLLFRENAFSGRSFLE